MNLFQRFSPLSKHQHPAAPWWSWTADRMDLLPSKRHYNRIFIRWERLDGLRFETGTPMSFDLQHIDDPIPSHFLMGDDLAEIRRLDQQYPRLAPLWTPGLTTFRVLEENLSDLLHAIIDHDGESQLVRFDSNNQMQFVPDDEALSNALCIPGGIPIWAWASLVQVEGEHWAHRRRDAWTPSRPLRDGVVVIDGPKGPWASAAWLREHSALLDVVA